MKLCINMIKCEGDKTLDSLYGEVEKVLVISKYGEYIIGEIQWEQGRGSNYYVEDSSGSKVYSSMIDLIGELKEDNIYVH